jgi:hypothetical protein
MMKITGMGLSPMEHIEVGAIMKKEGRDCALRHRKLNFTRADTSVLVVIPGTNINVFLSQ